MTDLRRFALLATPLERAENAASIAAIPATDLPRGEARDALLRLARAGADVYAYQPVASGWRIAMGQLYASWEPRMTPAEWQRVYALATSFAADDEAVLFITRRATALWGTAQRLDPHGPTIRPEGIDVLHWALSYLRWRMLLARGQEGLAHFRVVLADGYGAGIEELATLATAYAGDAGDAGDAGGEK